MSTSTRKISKSVINMFGEVTDGCGFNPIWNLDFSQFRLKIY